MSTQEELFKAIGENEALVTELREVWKQGAGAQDIADFLTSKGIDAPRDQVEALLAQAQKAKVDRIEAEDVDIDELNRMAGGGDGVCEGTATCDEYFKQYPNMPKDHRCPTFANCDEYFDTRFAAQ